MNRDQGLGPLGAGRHPGQRTLQLGDAGDAGGPRDRLRPARARRRRELALALRRAPRCQMRGVQAFAAQQRGELARSHAAGGGLQDL